MESFRLTMDFLATRHLPTPMCIPRHISFVVHTFPPSLRPSAHHGLAGLMKEIDVLSSSIVSIGGPAATAANYPASCPWDTILSGTGGSCVTDTESFESLYPFSLRSVHRCPSSCWPYATDQPHYDCH